MLNILKAKELRQMSESERDQKIISMRRELYGLKGRAQTGKLEKPSQIRIVRRDIARILTLKSEIKKGKQDV